MAAAGLGGQHERRAGLGEPVAQLGVLAEHQAGVQRPRLAQQPGVHRGGVGHVDAVRRVARRAEAVGAFGQVDDPAVRLTRGLVEELLRGPRRDGRVHVRGGRRARPVVDVPHVAHHHEVSGEVVPAHVRLDLVVEGHHVGVQPVDDVAARDRQPGVAGVGPAARARFRGDQPGVVRDDLGEAEGGNGPVVDDHDLHQMPGVALGGEGGEGQVELVLVAVGRDHHAHREPGLPGAGRGRPQHPVVVVPDPRLGRRGPVLGRLCHCSNSISPLGRNPRHWSLALARKYPTGSCQVCMPLAALRATKPRPWVR